MRLLALSLICGVLLAALPATDASAQAQPRLLALEAAATYREAARYPEWTQPVAPGALDPLLAKRTPTRQVLPGAQESGRQLAVWASDIAAEAGQTVDLFASIEQTAPASLRDALSRPRAATISATLVDDAGRTLGEVVYADDGRGADRVRNDGVYSARHTLAPEFAPAAGQAYSVMVKVRALAADGESFAAVGGFQYSHPGARLTGAITDSLRDGHLVLSAATRVTVPGRYHLQATLVDLAGTPVAQAQAAQVLAAGDQSIALTFHGLVLRDRGLTGALRVGSMTLTTTGTMPNALGPVLRNVAVLPARPLTVYSDRPFNRPELIEAAQRLEASVPRLLK